MKSQNELQRIWIGLFLLFFIIPCLLLITNVTWMIVPCLVIMVIFYLIRIDKKYYPYILFVVAFIIRICVMLSIETIPESDFEYQFYAAQKMLTRDYSFVDELYYGMKYYQIWPYHLGIVSFESFLLSIWNNIYMLQIVNCLANAGTAVLIYYITRKIMSQNASRVVSSLYCFFPFPATYVTVLSNQHMATFLTLLAICLLVSKKRVYNEYIRYILFSVILVFADVIRPESIIPLFATGLYLILTINKFKK